MDAVAVNMVACGLGIAALGALIAVMLAERWPEVLAALAWPGELSPREVQLSLPFAA